MTVVLIGSEGISKSLTPSITRRLEKPLKVNVPYIQNLTSLGGIKSLVRVQANLDNYNKLVALFYAAKESTKKVLYAHNIIQIIATTTKSAREVKNFDNVLNIMVIALEKIPEAKTMVLYLKNTQTNSIIANYQDFNEQTAKLFHLF